MVNAIAVFGISMDFLSIAINGTAAWTAANHCGENFSVCSRHTPRGTLADMPSKAVASVLAGKGWGRRFFTRAVRASAAQAATTAGGHLSFTPAGGCRAFATRGSTRLTAL